jgi:hypothetical protein
VTITLDGSMRKTAVTDANGSFIFRVPPGSYSLAPPRNPGTFVPASTDLANLVEDRIQDFSCAGACGAATTVVVVPERELVITDPTVVGDTRASNALAGAPWSFRFLMEQMTPAGVDPADFVGNWLGQFEIARRTVNGFPVDLRSTAALRALWPTTTGGKLDLARAPFRLLAIINRVDLHATSNGEVRFVYGAVDPSGAGRPMTVIFELDLPAKHPLSGTTLTRWDWAAGFHVLGGLPFGASYNATLQSITDLVTLRGTSPGKPGGSSIAQVRTNDGLTGDRWQLREFHLVATGAPTAAGASVALRLSPVAQTPADSAVVAGTIENKVLVSYLDTFKAAIHGGFASVPAGLLGGQSTQSFSWTFTAPVNADARHGFAAQTCNGCHTSETSGLQIDGFAHISPTADPGPDGAGRLSRFVKQVEIPRRTLFMQNQLTCSGPTCASGAEAAAF